LTEQPRRGNQARLFLACPSANAGAADPQVDGPHHRTDPGMLASPAPREVVITLRAPLQSSPR